MFRLLDIEFPLLKAARFTTKSTRLGMFVMLALALLGCGQLPRRAGEKSIAARELCRLGIDAMDGHRWQEAKARFAHALKTLPEDADARHHLAQVLWQQGDSYEAIAQLRGAIESVGSQPPWTVELGEMFLAVDDLDGALRCADIATDLDPKLASAWALRGHVLHRQGEFDEALGNFHLARSHGAEDVRVAMAISDIYARQNRPARVLSSLPESVVELDQQGILALRRGQAMKALGRHGDAVKMLRLAKTAQPQNQELLYELAEAQLLAGDPGAARRTVIELEASESARQLELVARIESAQPNMSTPWR